MSGFVRRTLATRTTFAMSTLTVRSTTTTRTMATLASLRIRWNLPRQSKPLLKSEDHHIRRIYPGPEAGETMNTDTSIQ